MSKVPRKISGVSGVRQQAATGEDGVVTLNGWQVNAEAALNVG